MKDEFEEQLCSLKEILSIDFNIDELLKIMATLFDIRNKKNDENKEVLYKIITDFIYKNYEARFNLITNRTILDEYFKYSNISNIIIANWSILKKFFDNFFGIEKYRQFFPSISKRFLENGNGETKDYFLIYFIINSTNKEQNEIIDELLSNGDNGKVEVLPTNGVCGNESCKHIKGACAAEFSQIAVPGDEAKIKQSTLAHVLGDSHKMSTTPLYERVVEQKGTGNCPDPKVVDNTKSVVSREDYS